MSVTVDTHRQSQHLGLDGAGRHLPPPPSPPRPRALLSRRATWPSCPCRGRRTPPSRAALISPGAREAQAFSPLPLGTRMRSLVWPPQMSRMRRGRERRTTASPPTSAYPSLRGAPALPRGRHTRVVNCSLPPPLLAFFLPRHLQVLIAHKHFHPHCVHFHPLLTPPRFPCAGTPTLRCWRRQGCVPRGPRPCLDSATVSLGCCTASLRQTTRGECFACRIAKTQHKRSCDGERQRSPKASHEIIWKTRQYTTQYCKQKFVYGELRLFAEEWSNSFRSDRAATGAHTSLQTSKVETPHERRQGPHAYLFADTEPHVYLTAHGITGHGQHDRKPMHSTMYASMMMIHHVA